MASDFMPCWALSAIVLAVGACAWAPSKKATFKTRKQTALLAKWCRFFFIVYYLVGKREFALALRQTKIITFVRKGKLKIAITHSEAGYVWCFTNFRVVYTLYKPPSLTTFALQI
jgi:hypothetical protein